MVIRKEETQRVHLSEVGVLIIESTAVSMTASLLNELNKQKVKVIFCDEYHNPFGEIIPYYGSHDCSKSIREQICWKDELKSIVWQEIIRNKILKQMEVLKKYKRYAEADLIGSYVSDVEPGDVTNREGHAAKVYFNALFGKNFIRDDGTIIVNSCLDYGYTLLLSCFNREITSTGRLTQLGIWHDNMFNYFNLSSDLMEEFRPIVDSFIMNLNLKETDDFNKEIKHKMLGILELDVMVDKRTQKLPNAIKIYCNNVFKILDEGIVQHLPKIEYV